MLNEKEDVMKYSAVILAAGSGSRMNMGYNKLLYRLDQQTIIEKTVNVFENDPACSQILLVLSQTDMKAMNEIFHDRVEYVLGGTQRMESSYAGVTHAKEKIVMIHDGARPYVSLKELKDCLQTMETHRACLLMVPVKDTIKVVKDNVVVSTPQRSDLMAALTPQCFEKDLICDCLTKAMHSDQIFSDDASVVEAFSDEPVQVVLGSYANKKITTKEDLF